MKPIRFISEERVGRFLNFPRSIELARQAYVRRANGEALEPLRSWFTVKGGRSFYFMPAHVNSLETVSVKVVSVNPRNGYLSLPSTSATVHVFNSKTGREVAAIAGNNLTAIRTAASSALATKVLALKDAETLGVIGTGKQALAHVPAILEVRDVSRVLAYSRSKAHRTKFVREASSNCDVPVTAARSVEQVARESDILVLATTSESPLFQGALVRLGAHVNAIGAALPGTREMDTTLVKRSVLVVDSFDQALTSYGDVMIPLKQKSIRRSHIRAELGELLLHPSILERRETDVTVFKAGGLAVLDAVFADYVVSSLHNS